MVRDNDQAPGDYSALLTNHCDLYYRKVRYFEARRFKLDFSDPQRATFRAMDSADFILIM